eukprot:IDg2289t1
MTTVLAFAAFPTLPFTSHPQYSISPHRFIPRCSMATTKWEPADENAPKVSRKPKPAHYRILPADLPAADRPPLPRIHHSIPFFGFMVYVTHYGAVNEILRDAHVFRSGDAFSAVEKIFMGNTPLTRDGDEHSIMRGILASGFAPNLFEKYFGIVHTHFSKMFDIVEQGMRERGRVLLDPVIREAYLSVLVEATTGIDMDGDRASFIHESFSALQAAVFSPPFGPTWNKMFPARAGLVAFLSDMIIKALIEQADAIKRLREYGDRLVSLGSREIAKGDVNELLILIARSDLRTGPGQAHDAKLLESLSLQLLGVWLGGRTRGAYCCSGRLSFHIVRSIAKMPLLESYLYEIMRIHPAIPGVMRVANKDVEVLGNLVREGESVYADLSAAMKDEKFYPDPMKLVPDRFLKKKDVAPPPRILTFGAPGSPHYCMGAMFSLVMMKTVLGMLLREYSLELDPTQSRTYGVVPDGAPVSKIVISKFGRK